MSKVGSNSKSCSSAQVDYFDLCTHNVRTIEDLVSGGTTLLNHRQSKDLSIKLSKATLNIREVVDKCGGSANLFRPAVEALYRCLEKARVLVSRCGEEDWCAAAVFQIHNENAFREILMEVGLCYNAIYEQARSLIGDSKIDVEDLRLTLVFHSASDDDILVDQQGLQKRLEDFAKEPRSVKLLDRFLTDKGALKQGLAKYLLVKLKYASEQAQATSLEACSELLWHKESELAGTWGKSARFLGAGAVGGVCKTKWMGIPCAKKEIHVKEYESLFLKEAGIMAHLKHPCIIDFFCCGNGQGTGDRFIAMEVMEKSLAQLIEDQKSVHFSIPVVTEMMVQMARGMCYLHDRGIAHRDLKPQNVVVSRVNCPHVGDYFCVKLVDFGMSKTKVEVSKSNTMTFVGIGTTQYRAPEVFRQAHPEGTGKATWFKADVYSFAMTCAHLLSLESPFRGMQNVNELYKKLISGDGPELPVDCPQELVALLNDCWNTNPKLRPSFMEVCTRLETFRHILLRGCERGVGRVDEGNMDLSAGFEFVKMVVEEQSSIQTTFVLSIDDEEEGGESKRELPILACTRGHALEFLPHPPSNYSGCCCDICRKDIEEELYHCDICQFDSHLDCVEIEVEVDVFFHDHPLHLLIQNYYNGNPDATSCHFCKEVVGQNEWMYSCNDCDFDVHAVCSKYPEETMKDTWHEHRLTLSQCPAGENLSCTCCNGEIAGNTWLYACTKRWCSVDFDVHPSCMAVPSKPLCIFENAHRLSLIRNRRGFYCGRCGALGFSWYYHCDHCDVDIHLDCINDMEEDERHWSEAYEEFMAAVMAEDSLCKMEMIANLLEKFDVSDTLEGGSSSSGRPSPVLERSAVKLQPCIRRLASSEMPGLEAIDFEDADLRRKIVAETAERKVERMAAKAGSLELKPKYLEMLEEFERIVLNLQINSESLSIGDGSVLALTVEDVKRRKYMVEEEMAKQMQSRMGHGPRTCLFRLNHDDGRVPELLTSLRAEIEGMCCIFLCEEPGHQHLVFGSFCRFFKGALGADLVQTLQPLLASGLEVVARAMSALGGELTDLDRVTLPCLGSWSWDLRAIDMEKHGKPSEDRENADELKRAEDSATEWILKDLEKHGISNFKFSGLLRVRYIETEEGDCPGYTRGSVAWLCNEHLNRGLKAGILQSHPMKFYIPEVN